MNNLTWFHNWYVKQMVKNFSNNFEVNIKTMMNSGWRVEINMTGINYEYPESIQLNKKLTDHNFFNIQIKDKKYIAEGDFTKLDFLIGKFRDLIGESKMEYPLKTDYFFSKKIQDFLFEHENDTIVFLHYTNNENDARNILKNGFEFAITFDRTTTEIRNDSVTLNYHHYIRKPFGDNIVVICISKKVYNSYIDEINKMLLYDVKVEELLTEKPPRLNEDADKVYTLHKKFVKGYFNYHNNEIVKNPEFNYSYDSEIFKENLLKANS